MRSSRKKDERGVKVFLEGSHVPVPDRARKEADMELFREQVRKLPECREKKFLVRFFEQAAFVHPVSWLVQFLLVLCGIWFCVRYQGEIAFIGISALMPLFAAVGGFELSKAVYYRMWELERSCRYDTGKIAGMKMLLFGMCDMAVLAVFSLLVWESGGSCQDVCQRVLLPFNLSAGIYLFVMERFPVRNGNVLLIGMGCALSAAQLLFGLDMERLSDRLEMAGTGLFMGASLLFLAAAAVRFCREKSREDEILWNLN